MISIYIVVSAVALVGATELKCKIDPKVNVDTWAQYVHKDEIGNVFASACGRNRGIFVLNPADGHTYGCAKFPEVWNITDANGIRKYPDPAHALDVLSTFIESVYFSTPEYVRKKDPGACDFEAMSVYECDKEAPWRMTPWASKLNAPIRAVNIAGLFIMQRWVTPGLIDWDATGITDERDFMTKCGHYGICGVLEDHWKNFYSQEDFHQMKANGLNSVRLLVGWWFFSKEGLALKEYPAPAASLRDENHPVTMMMRYAQKAGLQVILSTGTTYKTAVTKEELHERVRVTVASVTSYVHHVMTEFGVNNIMMLELNIEAPSVAVELALHEMAIRTVREVLPNMPVLLEESSLTTPTDYAHVYLNTRVYHGMAVQDLASDTSAGDREKMYAHEKIACGYQAPLHFTTCTRLPTFIGEFSLAIENCLPHVDANFQDYGQCSHIAERAASPWWQRHTASFAARQIATYEKELGWAFLTYKLDDTAEADGYSDSAVFWSFRLAVAAGLIDLSQPQDEGCLFRPPQDYAWGDEQPPEWWWQFQSVGPAAIIREALPDPATAMHIITGFILLAGLTAMVMAGRRRLATGPYEIIPVGRSNPTLLMTSVNGV